MKKMLILVVVLFAQSLSASPKVAMLGRDPNYVGTALEQTGGKSISFSIGSFAGFAYNAHGICGWYLRSCDLAAWPTFPQLVIFRMTTILQTDGWKVSGWPMQPQERLDPTYFTVTGTRNGETLEVHVTLFPEEGGKVAVAFSQRWTPKKEADKEPVPMAPSSRRSP